MIEHDVACQDPWWHLLPNQALHLTAASRNGFGL
jgi:hypothetical protein